MSRKIGDGCMIWFPIWLEVVVLRQELLVSYAKVNLAENETSSTLEAGQLLLCCAAYGAVAFGRAHFLGCMCGYHGHVLNSGL